MTTPAMKYEAPVASNESAMLGPCYGERQERQLKKDMFKSFYREQYVFWR